MIVQLLDTNPWPKELWKKGTSGLVVVPGYKSGHQPKDLRGAWLSRKALHGQASFGGKEVCF